MLHALEDLVTHCGAAMTPYVPAMLSLTTALLETVVKPVSSSHEDALMGDDGMDDKDGVSCEHSDEDDGKDQPEGAPSAPIEGRKALTSGSVRLLALLLQQYPAAHDLSPLWTRLMPCAEALLPRVIHEVSY